MTTFRLDTPAGVVFLLGFIISFALTCGYDVFRVPLNEKKPRYNFHPFPSFSLTDIPNADIKKASVCQRSLTKPDDKYQCSMCGGDDFVATTVIKGENVRFNDSIVPPGTWCLPKGKNEAGCAAFTGKTVWSYDPFTGRQGWSCVCLYPDMYGGEYCQDKYACSDTSGYGGSQEANLLTHFDATGKAVSTWNPLSPGFDPAGKTPYDRDPATGKPYYMCSCDQNKTAAGEPMDMKTQYVRMPNDPYRCHIDPCCPSKQGQAAGFNTATQQCDCANCISNGKGGDLFIHSNVTGVCYQAKTCNKDSPDSGTWNPDLKRCQCAEKYLTKVCNSNLYSRPSAPDCPPEEMNNPGGSYCYDPCAGMPCVTGTCYNSASTSSDRCTPDAGRDFCCKCDENHTGRLCENAIVQQTDPKGIDWGSVGRALNPSNW